MKRLALTTIVLLTVGLPSVTARQQNPSGNGATPDFKGSWVADGRTSAIVAVRIADDPETKLKIFVSGACSPTPCQWEPVKFFLLRDATPRVFRMGDPPAPPPQERGFASWPGGKAVVAYFDGDQLVVDAYSVPEKQNERGNPLANFTVTKLHRG